MKKSERGEIDFLEGLFIAMVVIGLVFGVGPCRDCFYDEGEIAPMQQGK